ncbi:Crp/Fnr family transcriptional regulator [Prevotella sp.]|uniref:Crp/Fnr family transcriptional regulator n=1 Tax=Prevotella sp. TaxID=59823 RepID=UPI002F93C7DF
MISKPDLRKEEVIQAISNLWSPLTLSQRQSLLDNVTLRQFKKNEIIYNDFDKPEYMICLIHGKVKIHKDGIGGRNQILRVIKPIEFFGFRAYFAEEHYKAIATALEPSLIASFPMDIILQLMQENFNISLFFMHHLARQLGYSDDRTISLTQKHIRGRLAEALLFLKDNYGLEEDGYTLSIYMSREDLANLSNMTTSNAIRTLSALAAEKIIAIDGRKIKLINIEELELISKLG